MNHMQKMYKSPEAVITNLLASSYFHFSLKMIVRQRAHNTLCDITEGSFPEMTLFSFPWSSLAGRLQTRHHKIKRYCQKGYFNILAILPIVIVPIVTWVGAFHLNISVCCFETWGGERCQLLEVNGTGVPPYKLKYATKNLLCTFAPLWNNEIWDRATVTCWVEWFQSFIQRPKTRSCLGCNVWNITEKKSVLNDIQLIQLF